MTIDDDDEWMKNWGHLATTLTPRELRILRERFGAGAAGFDEQMSIIIAQLKSIEKKVHARLASHPPPSHTKSRITTDEHGVWVCAKAGTYFGINWSELCAVSASRVDVKERTEIILGFEVTYGECIEVNASFDGFSELVVELTKRLSLESTWFEILQENTTFGVVLVWTSPNV